MHWYQKHQKQPIYYKLLKKIVFFPNFFLNYLLNTRWSATGAFTIGYNGSGLLKNLEKFKIIKYYKFIT